jgi:hypothetical protein
MQDASKYRQFSLRLCFHSFYACATILSLLLINSQFSAVIVVEVYPNFPSYEVVFGICKQM